MDSTAGPDAGDFQSLPDSPGPAGPQLGAAPGNAGDGVSPGAAGTVRDAAPPTVAATPGPPPAPAARAPAFPEVEGSSLTLREEIDTGNVELPGLLDWGAWQFWRREVGREPPRPRSEPHGFRLRRESLLWKSTMSYIYGPNWKQLLRQYGDDSPAPFQDRVLVPAGMPPGSSGAPPATTAGAGASLEVAQASAAGPETFELGSHQSDDVFSQGSWAEKSTAEIRAMLRDF